MSRIRTLFELLAFAALLLAAAPQRGETPRAQVS